MDILPKPVKPGQICKLLSDAESENVFIITTQPASINNDEIEVVSLSDLQRNNNQPENVERQHFKISEIEIIAEDLTTYIHSWNN